MFIFCELVPRDYWEIQTLAKCEFVSEFLVYWAAYAAKKNFQVLCTYEENAMQTTKYGIIWSENVHFVTNLKVTGTGGLYPRVRDF